MSSFEGITLSALWTRLEKRNPPFPLKMNTASQYYLWRNVIQGNEELEFYVMPEPRPPLVLFDRFEYTDPESDIVMEQVNDF